MINREYIKSQIDILPESVIIGIDKYITEQSKKNIDKSKRNAEYNSMLDRSFKQSEEGKTVTFEMEELIAMETMSSDETRELIEKAKLRGNSK